MECSTKIDAFQEQKSGILGLVSEYNQEEDEMARVRFEPLFERSVDQNERTDGPPEGLEEGLFLCLRSIDS